MRQSLRDALQKVGLRLKDDWLSACAAHLQATHAGFDSLPLDRQARACSVARGAASSRRRETPLPTLSRVARCAAVSLSAQVELVYAQFLDADLNTAGAGCLPDVEARRLRVHARAFAP